MSSNFAKYPLIENMRLITGLSNTTPSTTTPRYVSLKDYGHVTVIIQAKNATTVTGSAITLKQATAVAGTSEKTLGFTGYWANTDVAAAPNTQTATTAASNTFTTNATNSKESQYIIEVDASQLDTANGFDCFRVGTGDATATTLTVSYILSRPRFAPGLSPIVD